MSACWMAGASEVEDSAPQWLCGHRHRTKGGALKCLGRLTGHDSPAWVEMPDGEFVHNPLGIDTPMAPAVYLFPNGQPPA
jgi:hypothetical protein